MGFCLFFLHRNIFMSLIIIIIIIIIIYDKSQ